MRIKYSLRTKFTATIYTLSATAMIMALMLSLFLYYDFYTAQQKTTNLSIVESMNSILALPVSISDYAEVQRILGFYSSDTENSTAAVIVNDEILLGDYSKYQVIKEALKTRAKHKLNCSQTSEIKQFKVYCYQSKSDSFSILYVKKNSFPISWYRISLLLVLFTVLIALIILFSNDKVRKLFILPIEQLTSELGEFELQDISNLSFSLDANDSPSIEFSKLRKSFTRLLKKLQNEQAQVITLSKNRATYELARSLAHDIRSPVSALLVAAQSVATKPDEATQLIKSAAERIERIANDLLIHTNNGPSEFIQTDLTAMISELVREKSYEFADQAEITITQITEENKKALLCSKDIDLKRLLSNIINNSIESSHGQNTIRISTSIAHSSTKITISDQGAGMPEDILKVLNSDTEAPITTKKNGHGIGLSAAKKVIKLCNGSMFIRSKIGHGTVIDITLPTTTLS